VWTRVVLLGSAGSSCVLGRCPPHGFAGKATAAGFKLLGRQLAATIEAIAMRPTAIDTHGHLMTHAAEQLDGAASNRRHAPLGIGGNRRVSRHGARPIAELCNEWLG